MNLARATREERLAFLFRALFGGPRDWTDEDDRGPYDRSTADYYNFMDQTPETGNELEQARSRE